VRFHAFKLWYLATFSFLLTVTEGLKATNKSTVAFELDGTIVVAARGGTADELRAFVATHAATFPAGIQDLSGYKLASPEVTGEEPPVFD
jgi:hypothetical protein